MIICTGKIYIGGRDMNRKERVLEIDEAVLSFFKMALLSSYSKITRLLQEQRELGLRKKSENWTIYLSNYLNDFYSFNTTIKKTKAGYKYVEMILDTSTSTTIIICHLQYLKQRTRFPRPALYRDMQRMKNPSIQQEFTHPSFFNKTKNEIYYLFCFGEDEKGIFGIFKQPDGQAPIYYAESKNCIDTTIIQENHDAINEKPDISVYDIKTDIINRFNRSKA